MRKRAMEVLKRVHLDSLNPDAEVGPLDTSQKQLIEIARALLYDARLIIMDEPTTALSDEEIQNLFEIMRGLKAEGVSMIYISHKMPELFEICDRFTVLRDGKFIASGNFRDIDETMATTMLVGQHISDQIEKENCMGEVILEAKNISCGRYFQNLSFELHRGEVLAFSGLQGDGRGELAEALFGIRKLSSGMVLMEGKQVRYRSVADAMRAGIGMVQRNRKERSIIRNMEDVVLKNIGEDAWEITIELEIEQKAQTCPHAKRRPVASTIIMIARYGIRLCVASGRRSATGEGDISAPDAGRSSPRHAALLGAIGASPIGTQRKPPTCRAGATV